MPQIYLCFLWHMHQPFYKDLVSGEYKLPWTRMHALKDYYGMARILEEFPSVRQTFNLVPSMMAQVAEYASGEAVDPFLELALKPAENLTDADRAFLLRHSFYSDPQRMIYRYPRYGELFDAWQAQKHSGARACSAPQDFRDLQMWSQLAWFDEEFQEHDPEVREWMRARPRLHPRRPARAWAKSSARSWAACCRTTGKLAASGPDRNLHHAVLPPHPAAAVRFRYRRRVASRRAAAAALPLSGRCPPPARAGARVRARSTSAWRPPGLWPSEGSVSDEVFAIAAEARLPVGRHR